jgi:hypothetical protein
VIRRAEALVYMRQRSLAGPVIARLAEHPQCGSWVFLLAPPAGAGTRAASPLMPPHHGEHAVDRVAASHAEGQSADDSQHLKTPLDAVKANRWGHRDYDRVA